MATYFIHILLAVLLGTGIGLERQLRQRVAGLRTNALVALGAAIFMVMATEIGGDATARVESYIISGIGFLGAGVIIKDGASIRGLNTAATLWCTAAIGAFCGLGYVIEPVMGTVAIVSIHLILRPLTTKIKKTFPFVKKETEEYHYQLIASCKEEVENHIRVQFVQYIGNNNDLLLSSLTSYDGDTPATAIIEADILSNTRQDAAIESIASFLTVEEGVTSIKWEADSMDSHS